MCRHSLLPCYTSGTAHVMIMEAVVGLCMTGLPYLQGARDLESLVSVGQQQPYYILECGQQRSRSKPCASSGTNPVWNTAHKFALGPSDFFAKVWTPAAAPAAACCAQRRHSPTCRRSHWAVCTACAG